MAETANYPKVAQLKDVADLPRAPRRTRHLAARRRPHPLRRRGSPLAQPMQVAGFTVGNRWCIHPMEGWDANRDGSPTEHTLRRWQNFGRSGAKLIWGGEAAAVRPDGRANPNQTLATESNRAGLAALLQRTSKRPPRILRLARRPPRRPAAHPLRPLLQTRRSPPQRTAYRLLGSVWHVKGERS